jgi:hypothetical protein
MLPPWLQQYSSTHLYETTTLLYQLFMENPALSEKSSKNFSQIFYSFLHFFVIACQKPPSPTNFKAFFRHFAEFPAGSSDGLSGKM